MEFNLSSLPFIFLGIFVLCGNCFLLSLYFTNRSLRTVTNMFVMSLAFCDTIIATVFIPMYVLQSKYGSNYVAALASFGSLFNLLALTYERYVAIFHSLHYFSIMDDKKIRLLMAEVWASTILVTLFPLPWEITLSKADFTLWTRVYSGILTTLVILATIVVFFVYGKIFKVSAYHARRDQGVKFSSQSYRQLTADTLKTPNLAKQNSLQIDSSTERYRNTDEPHISVASPGTDSRNVERSRISKIRRPTLLREIKAARIVAIIFLFNFLCWLPIIIINICDVISSTGQADYIPMKFLTASQYLFVINSLVNPFIYAFCKKDFRHVIRKRKESLLRAMRDDNEMSTSSVSHNRKKRSADRLTENKESFDKAEAGQTENESCCRIES